MPEKCCTSRPGYRSKCPETSPSGCELVGCCWDSTRSECFRRDFKCSTITYPPAPTKSPSTTRLPVSRYIPKTLAPQVQAEWFLWSGWHECNCEVRKQERFRGCNRGMPGQGHCIGKNYMFKPCEDGDLKRICSPSKWASWEEWGSCSTSCGEGQKTRYRSCSENEECEGPAKETAKCYSASCPTWSTWSDFGQCSATCSVGLKTRTRACYNGECAGEAQETIPCDSGIICATWSDWASWAQCSASCGPGTTMRSRTCGGGAEKCEGNSIQQKICLRKRSTNFLKIVDNFANYLNNILTLKKAISVHQNGQRGRTGQNAQKIAVLERVHARENALNPVMTRLIICDKQVINNISCGG
jgi:hypothetical protein